MKVVSFKICPFVQRVTALLEAKNVAYDVEYIELSNKPDWFLKVSPNAQVPLLITDEDQILFESDAIVEYIDEVTGVPLSSNDPVKKAQDRAWSYLASKNYLLQCNAQRSPDSSTLEERSLKLSNALRKIETRLGDDPFANGNDPGMIDIAWLPLLHRASIIERHSGYDFLKDFPRAKRWQRDLLATGIAEKSIADDFEDRFNAFYLAEVTQLGQLTRNSKGTTCCQPAAQKRDDMACCV
jgi:glutathione S-transferase